MTRRVKIHDFTIDFLNLTLGEQHRVLEPFLEGGANLYNVTQPEYLELVMEILVKCLDQGRMNELTSRMAGITGHQYRFIIQEQP